MRINRFPGDSLLLGDSRYRLRRIGRDEWLNDRGEITTDAEATTDFGSATEAAWWLIHHVEQPQLWHSEEFFTIAA